MDNSVETAPAFGRSISSDDEVFEFYRYWESFVTVLTFAWMDRYDRREAANRMERRAIDKFNKKLRVEAREKYIDLVRNLVAFCKTRDVRYARARQTRQTEREKQKFKQKEESERKRKERVAREEEAREHFEELERARVEQEKLEGKDAFKLAEEEETTQTDEVLFQCEICDKFFKSEKQLANHERSKKHKEKLKKLQHELRRQEALAKKSLASKKEASSPKKQAPAAVEKDPDGDAQSSSSSSEGSDEESDDYLDVFYNPQSRRRYDDELTEEDDDDDDKEEAEENEDDGDNEDGEVPTDTDDVEALKDGEPSGQVDKEHVDKYAGKQGDDEGSQAVDDSHLEEEETNHHDQNEQKETTVDAKFQTSKEANSVQKGNEVLQPGDSSSNKQKPEANETEHKCAICKAGFPSRNQLFKHIKSTGHAELKATTDVPSKRRQQRRKGKKRR